MARRSTTPRSASARAAVRIERTHLALGVAAVAALTLILLMLWNGVSGQFLTSNLMSTVASGNAPDYIAQCTPVELAANTAKTDEIRKPIAPIAYPGTSDPAQLFVGVGVCGDVGCPARQEAAVEAINAAHLTKGHSCLGFSGDRFTDDGMLVGNTSAANSGASVFNRYRLTGFAVGDVIVVDMKRTGNISAPLTYFEAKNDSYSKDVAIQIMDSTGAFLFTSDDALYPGSTKPEHVYQAYVLKGTAPFYLITGFHGSTVSEEGAYTVTARKQSDFDRCLAERSQQATTADLRGETISACTEATCNSASPKSCSLVPTFDAGQQYKYASTLYPLDSSPRAYNLYTIAGSAGTPLDITCESATDPSGTACSAYLFTPNPTDHSAPVAEVDRSYSSAKHLQFTPTTTGAHVLMVWLGMYAPGSINIHIDGAAAATESACTAGQTKCSGVQIQTCTAAGQWGTATTCTTAGQTCGGTEPTASCRATAGAAAACGTGYPAGSCTTCT